MRFAGARVAADGTDPQSGYSEPRLGFVRDVLEEGPFFGDVLFTGAHRDSVRMPWPTGRPTLAAIDVRSWWLALRATSRAAAGRLCRDRHDRPDAGGRLRGVVGAEGPGRGDLDRALHEAMSRFVGTPAAARLHVSGYRSRVGSRSSRWSADPSRRMRERHPWHRYARSLHRVPDIRMRHRMRHGVHGGVSARGG